MYQEIIKVENIDRLRVIQFDSVFEFSKTKTDNPKCMEILDNDVLNLFDSNGNAVKYGWFGGATKKEIEETLRVGNDKYVKLVEENLISLPEPRNIRRRKINSDFGDEVCVHQINSGNFSTAWKKRSPKVKVSARNLKLIINTDQNCGVSEEKSKWVGVAALAVAKAFEEAGYNIAIDIIMGSKEISEEESILFIVPVKQYESPLDIRGLTSMACSPAFFRWPGFMNLGYADGEIYSGLGSSWNPNFLRDKVIEKYYKNPMEIVEFIGNDCTSEEKAKKEIQRISQKFGEFDLLHAA